MKSRFYQLPASVWAFGHSMHAYHSSTLTFYTVHGALQYFDEHSDLALEPSGPVGLNNKVLQLMPVCVFVL